MSGFFVGGPHLSAKKNTKHSHKRKAIQHKSVKNG